MRERVVADIGRAGTQGLARFEIADLLGKSQNDITSTVEALSKLGLIKETSRKRLNSRTNQKAFVIVATEYFEAAA